MPVYICVWFIRLGCRLYKPACSVSCDYKLYIPCGVSTSDSDLLSAGCTSLDAVEAHTELLNLRQGGWVMLESGREAYYGWVVPV